MGFAGDFDRPEFLAAVDALLAACARHGKAAGVLSGDVAEALAWRRRGFRCLGYGADASLFRDALAEGIASVRAGSPADVA